MAGEIGVDDAVLKLRLFQVASSATSPVSTSTATCARVCPRSSTRRARPTAGAGGHRAPLPADRGFALATAALGPEAAAWLDGARSRPTTAGGPDRSDLRATNENAGTLAVHTPAYRPPETPAAGGAADRGHVGHPGGGRGGAGRHAHGLPGGARLRRRRGRAAPAAGAAQPHAGERGRRAGGGRRHGGGPALGGRRAGRRAGDRRAHFHRLRAGRRRHGGALLDAAELLARGWWRSTSTTASAPGPPRRS